MDSMDRKITQCLVYDGRATFRRIADVRVQHRERREPQYLAGPGQPVEHRTGDAVATAEGDADHFGPAGRGVHPADIVTGSQRLPQCRRRVRTALDPDEPPAQAQRVFVGPDLDPQRS